MIGFIKAWQLTNDPRFAELSLKTWVFVKNKILDYTNGEWFCGITDKGNVMPGEDKAGLWNCPYHNTRAYIEVINRIDRYILG